MKTSVKLLIVGALAVVVIAALALKPNNKRSASDSGASLPVTSQPAPAGDATRAAPGASSPLASAQLPNLLNLGADKCIPCKMMAPILEEWRREYAGRLEVEFIEVWKNPDASQRYGIQMIPTQIFYDAEGRERARHVGFIGKEDILAKFRELDVDVGKK